MFYTAETLDKLLRWQGFFKFPDGWHKIQGYDGRYLFIQIVDGRMREANFKDPR